MSKVIAMKAVKAMDHPDADALRVYEFEACNTTLQVVANLENVYEVGDIVAVAMEGTFLSDGTEIRPATIRGIPSHGMALGKAKMDAAQGDDLSSIYCSNEPRKPQMIKWPSIEHLHHITKGVRAMFKGNDARPPVVKYKAKDKVDGCFHRRTKITMWDNSKKRITQIEPGEYVLGVGDNGNVVKTKVLNRFENGISNDWVEVRGYRTSNESEGTSGIFTIKCTPNHLIWCESKNKYVAAKHLKPGDVVHYNRKPELALSFTQSQVLLGKLLGDASYAGIEESAHIGWGHREQDKDYIDWTLKALDKLGKPAGTAKSGYGSTMVRARTLNSAHIKTKFESFVSGGKKSIPKWVADELYPLAIAFWYMDDGSLCHNDQQRDRAVFHTNHFTQKDCEVLLSGLNKFGICGSINNDGASKGKSYPAIHIDTDSSDKLFSLIAPYIPPCMQRKLPEHYRGYPGFIPKTDLFYRPSLVKRKIISVDKCASKDKKHDLETETHNYFANGVLVHNSNGGVQVFSDGRVIAQSHSRLLIDCDNYQFGAWVKENESYFQSIARDDHMVVFGEWCGEGIQKRCSISQVKNKLFAVFALKVNYRYVFEPQLIQTYLSPHDDIYVIPWIKDFEVELDYGALSDKLQEQADAINKLVAEVEQCDPWVKDTFGIEGLGEGVVMYPTNLEPKDFVDYLFKAKGEAHQVVRTKKSAQVTPEAAAGLMDFVKLVITPARLEQGVTEACDGEFDIKKMGSFLKWIAADVQKECQDELTAAGLTWKAVGKKVSAEARDWYKAKAMEL